MNYILASNSPRRKQILTQMGIEFEVRSPKCDETLDTDVFSYPLVENLALMKAKAVQEELKYPAIIISADTVVVFGGKIFTKPKNDIEAFEMLKKLSGKTHKVVTAHCVLTPVKSFLESDTSYVTFSNLNDKQIKDYINRYNPLDKAGAYGIQEMPPGYIKEYKGSLSNIIGLSANTLSGILKNLESEVKDFKY